ncbi:MAG: Gfo/Idh/MocA family protein [Gemmatimonadota bacterium]
MSGINLCILGCGSIARLHSRIARTLRPQLNLLYASRSLQKAEAYRRRFKGAGAFGSYEEACGSLDVDAILICTPHALHVEHALLGARHGKHLLIEKPVTRDLAQLTQIERAVERAGVVCMVAENYHFKPVVRVLRHHLEAGDIGDPIFIELNKTGGHPADGWRADAQMMGGGALLEGGIHWIHLVLCVGGPAREVIAARPTHPSPRHAPFEDNLEVLLKFDNGSIGKLLHSWSTSNRLGGLQASKIYGTAGNITFESNGLWALVLGRRKRLRIPGWRDMMGRRGMLKEFLACVREGREPAVSLAVARRDLEVVLAAYRSLSSGRFERVAAHGDSEPRKPTGAGARERESPEDASLKGEGS